MCTCSVAQSYLTLCNPMVCSPPGSSVLGILQAGILEWVAKHSSRGSSQLRNWTCISHISCIGKWGLDPKSHQGSTVKTIVATYWPKQTEFLPMTICFYWYLAPRKSSMIIQWDDTKIKTVVNVGNTGQSHWTGHESLNSLLPLNRIWVTVSQSHFIDSIILISHMFFKRKITDSHCRRGMNYQKIKINDYRSLN